jgi:hypothetical protein
MERNTGLRRYPLEPCCPVDVIKIQILFSCVEPDEWVDPLTLDVKNDLELF